MPALLQMIFGETGGVLPMRLERVTCTALAVDLIKQRVAVEELHLLMAPHDPPGIDATLDDVDRAIRRLNALSSLPGEDVSDLRLPPHDLAESAAAVAPAKLSPSDGADLPTISTRRWLGPLRAFLNLTSSRLLPRIFVGRLYMHQAHLRRGVPMRPFAIEASLAEIVLMWMCMAYPGAGAEPGFAVVPAIPPRPWHNGKLATGQQRRNEDAEEAEPSLPVETCLAQTL